MAPSLYIFFHLDFAQNKPELETEANPNPWSQTPLQKIQQNCKPNQPRSQITIIIMGNTNRYIEVYVFFDLMGANVPHSFPETASMSDVKRDVVQRFNWYQSSIEPSERSEHYPLKPSDKRIRWLNKDPDGTLRSNKIGHGYDLHLLFETSR